MSKCFRISVIVPNCTSNPKIVYYNCRNRVQIQSKTSSISFGSYLKLRRMLVSLSPKREVLIPRTTKRSAPEHPATQMRGVPPSRCACRFLHCVRDTWTASAGTPVQHVAGAWLCTTWDWLQRRFARCCATAARLEAPQDPQGHRHLSSVSRPRVAATSERPGTFLRLRL